MDRQSGQVFSEIRAVGFDAPGGPPDRGGTETGAGTKGGRAIKRASEKDGMAFLEGSLCRDIVGFDEREVHLVP